MQRLAVSQRQDRSTRCFGWNRLQPANPDFQPIIVRNCKIQGIVIGVLRRY